MPALNEERQARRDEFNTAVGSNIKRVRARKGVSPQEIAEAADMDISKLYRIEAGERAISLSEALAVATKLRVSLYIIYNRK